MYRLQHAASAVNGFDVIVGLGLAYVALGVVKVATVLDGGTATAAAVDFALIGIPGLALVYGGRWLRRSELPERQSLRVVGWCVGGFATILVIVELVNLEPGVIIVNLFWANVLATAIGTGIGFVLGVNDARAVTKAREVETVNEKLQRVNRELERQNERLESFASMLAHELRNPLTIAQIYLPRMGEEDSAREEVTQALDRIEEMIEVLLVTARKVDPEIESEPISLADAAGDAWEDLRVECADLVVETDRTVRANPIHLRHLLENLFRNSIEHAGPDVTVRVGDLPSVSASSEGRGPSDRSSGRSPREDDAREGPEDERSESSGGFYVEDDGPGIPESDRDRVFDAGFTTEGIGFGLAFVSRLADAYGWKCSIVEGRDGGARFEFADVEIVTAEDRQPN